MLIKDALHASITFRTLSYKYQELFFREIPQQNFQHQVMQQ